MNIISDHYQSRMQDREFVCWDRKPQTLKVTKTSTSKLKGLSIVLKEKYCMCAFKIKKMMFIHMHTVLQYVFTHANQRHLKQFKSALQHFRNLCDINKKRIKVCTTNEICNDKSVMPRGKFRILAAKLMPAWNDLNVEQFFKWLDFFNRYMLYLSPLQYLSISIFTCSLSSLWQ